MTGLRLVLAGAAIGNGNRGVEALARSVLDSVDREQPGSLVSLLDDGWGVRVQDDPRAAQKRYPQTSVEYVGVRRSRRWHRPESWAQIRVAQRLGLRRNPVALRFAAADAVLDLSAGDSFTDLYGPGRLATVSAPKAAAIRAGRPLVLLPQTYGPFETEQGRRSAERLVRAAALAYARDEWSHQRLVELAGSDADRTRLRQGVDVAFALEPRRPAGHVGDVRDQSNGPIVGVNVSGLLRDAAGQAQFRLAGDYLETMTSVVRGLLTRGAHVVFVPHVHEASGAGESDLAGINDLRARLTEQERARTTCLPPTLDAAELKWCIARCDWFVGSRMHATIGALSTLTPACAYAYSDKTIGVFESCGMGEHVVDARRVHGAEAASSILSSFDQRESARTVLELRAPSTIETSRSQLREILETVACWRDGALRAESIA